MSTKKDRLFILVIALVAANLFYSLVAVAVSLSRDFSWGLTVYLISIMLAMAGCLWLLQSYRIRRRIEKEQQDEKTSK